MRKMIVAVVLVFGCTLLSGTSSMALDKLVESVAKGCEKEITTYCKDVTPGEGRILACLYAHEDKLTGSCEYALYDAAVQLERVVAALTYVANECREDLRTYCSDVKPGEGRLIDCIEKNKQKVSDRCKQAISDIGLKKVK
ncbi:MAG TPA: hypothetical protein DDX85_13670 [Nitrospiraceae bacterium]|nr:hypothetical protein [Nitrospiraceae bacterium]